MATWRPEISRSDSQGKYELPEDDDDNNNDNNSDRIAETLYSLGTLSQEFVYKYPA
jgi:hypothetical protein